MDLWLYPTPRVSPQSSSGMPWSRSERRFPWTPPIILIGACRCCRYINLQTDIWDVWPEERRSRNRYDAVADPPLVQEPSLQDKYRQIKCVYVKCDRSVQHRNPNIFVRFSAAVQHCCYQTVLDWNTGRLQCLFLFFAAPTGCPALDG